METNDLASIGLAVIGLLAFAVLAAVLLHEGHRYKYDGRNPARRWCRKCGQREELYGMNIAEGFQPTGWEIMYPISKHPCNRHQKMLNEMSEAAEGQS